MYFYITGMVMLDKMNKTFWGMLKLLKSNQLQVLSFMSCCITDYFPVIACRCVLMPFTRFSECNITAGKKLP